MFISFIRNNITLVSVALFIVLFTTIMYIKPAFLFNKNGSIRNFGLGYKKKTVIPVWLVSILLGILAYFIVIYYITLPRFKN